MRRGASQPFIYRGKVKKILSDRMFIIETNGRSTQCNSTNLKPTPNRDEDYEDAVDAFRHSGWDDSVDGGGERPQSSKILIVNFGSCSQNSMIFK